MSEQEPRAGRVHALIVAAELTTGDLVVLLSPDGRLFAGRQRTSWSALPVIESCGVLCRGEAALGGGEQFEDRALRRAEAMSRLVTGEEALAQRPRRVFARAYRVEDLLAKSVEPSASLAWVVPAQWGRELGVSGGRNGAFAPRGRVVYLGHVGPR